MCMCVCVCVHCYKHVLCARMNLVSRVCAMFMFWLRERRLYAHLCMCVCVCGYI